MGEATKGIMQKARMAKDLYEQQAAIENQVKERCVPRLCVEVPWRRPTGLTLPCSCVFLSCVLSLKRACLTDSSLYF